MNLSIYVLFIEDFDWGGQERYVDRSCASLRIRDRCSEE